MEVFMNSVILTGKVSKVVKEGIYEFYVVNGKNVKVILCLVTEKKEKVSKYIYEGRMLAIAGKLCQNSKGSYYILTDQIDFLDSNTASTNTFTTVNSKAEVSDSPF